MKAPHEETWELTEPGDPEMGVPANDVINGQATEVFLSARVHPDRLRLAAAAPEMARLLLTMCRDWPGTDGACMYCDAYPETQPHSVTCKVGAVLRKAGVI